MTSFILEFLLTDVAVFVRKIAIEREGRVLHQRIDAEMNALDRFAARRDHVKRGIELREISSFR